MIRKNDKISALEEFNVSDFAALFAAVNTAALVSMTDIKGNIIYVNDLFVSVSKYSREELIGKNHRILKSGQQPDAMFIGLWKTISSGKVWRGDIMNRAKDGSYYWVDSSIAPIFNNEGKIHRYIAVRFLITAKKDIEMKLIEKSKESENAKRATLNILEDLSEEQVKLETQVKETLKFSMALESTKEHVVITDPEGNIVYANPGVEHNTGFTRKEMLGTKIGKLWGGKMDRQFYEKLWHTIKVEKETFEGIFNNVKKNGSPYIAEVTISPVKDEKGRIFFFVGVERDITHEKDIDRAKTEFVSLASHQLRTPLTSISWYTEMLLAGDAGKLTDDQKKYLQDVYTSNKRMIGLVNDLLNVSRLELGTFKVDCKPMDLLGLANTIVGELDSQLKKKKLKLKTHFPKKMSKYMGDEKLLGMIIQNLLSNAVKYTQEKGQIEMEISMQKKDLLISVKDNGLGIPKHQQNKIFSKLFRADNVVQSDTEGTGLGLYIIKSIVEKSNGKIWFESKLNKGTTFYVTLPKKGMLANTGIKELD